MWHDIKTRWRALTALASSAVLLGACAAGPDFHSPADDSASQFRLPVPAQATVSTAGSAGQAQRFHSDAPIAADWYRLFQSPVLDDLIARALAHNPSLQASQARLRQAAHQLEAVSGSHFPDLDAGGQASRQRANGAQIGLDNPLFNNVFNLYDARLSLSYDLDLFGASRRATEAQQARVDYQQNLLRGSLLTLVDNVVVTTVHYAALHDRLAATRHIIAAEQDQVALLDKQETAGAVAYADVLRARAQLADSQAMLPPLQHDLTVTGHALARLVGSDPARFPPPALSLDDLSLPAELPVSLPSSLVRQRPDILAAEAQLHQATAELGVASAHLYPNITLTASLGSAANHTGDLFSSPAQIWNLGGALSAPLFHGGSLRAQRDAARAALDASYARYRNTVLGAFTQVSDVLDAISQDAATLKAQDHALNANRDSLQLVRKQYQAGAAGYLDVLSAEQRFNRALLAHVDAASQRYADTAALYHALGGGWWQPPTTPDSVATAPRAD
ncbi:MAG: efflux transporter outer membrane subunit [Alcanivorax sp.]|nr:efflux transporter outer membrane subunit [Alcanivorax sp.]